MWPIPFSLVSGQQLIAVAPRNRIGRIEHDLAGEFRPVLFGNIRDRLVGHCNQEGLAKIERGANRSGFRQGAKAVDKGLSSSGWREENSTG